MNDVWIAEVKEFPGRRVKMKYIHKGLQGVRFNNFRGTQISMQIFEVCTYIQEILHAFSTDNNKQPCRPNWLASQHTKYKCL